MSSSRSRLAVLAARSPRCSSPPAAPRRGSPSRRRRRSTPPAPSTAVGSSRAATDRADRRARLHPERPVRAVLPRRPGRLLRGRRASTVTFQNEIDADLVPLVGAGRRSTSASPTGRASSRRSARASRSSTSRRSTASSRSIVFAKASVGITTRGGPRRARRSASPGGTARRGSCSRRCSRSADLTPDDVEIVEYPDFGQGAAVAAGRGRCRDRVRQQRAGPARARPASRSRSCASTTSRRCRVPG